MSRACKSESGSPIGPLLSIEQFARVLNISRRTAERLLASGRLPKADLRLGRIPRWRPETVRRFLDSGSP
jgi:excisionase family DNA binding protein